MRRLLYTLCLLSLSGCITLLTRPNSLDCEAGSPGRCEGNTLIVCVDGIELQQNCGGGTCDAASGTCAEVAPGCGNGITEEGLGEECDDGNLQNGDDCDQNCQIEVVVDCGDGIPQAGEQCDDGNQSNTDACTNACINARCGDGFVRTGTETCDDGNTTNGDGCSAACQLENNNCGNGTVQAGEECDDGNQSNTDACTNNCDFAICGDGFVRAGVEQCDDGNTNNNDACRNTCTLQNCGNGVVNAGEECDDGNQVAGDFTSDFCDPNCQNPGCGNGFLGNFEIFPGFSFPETCDDGNLTPGDGCDSQCFVEGTAVCGNGTVESGEGCDDGDTTSGDGCSSTCQVEGAVCGNFSVEAGEDCDDGNTISGDGCSSTCQDEGGFCGDFGLDANETCDDGDNFSGDGCSAICQNENNTAGSCASPHPAFFGVRTRTTSGQPNVSDGSCQLAVTGGGGGGDVIFRLTAAVTGTVNFNLTSNSDHGIFLESTCGGTELDCADVDFEAAHPGTPESENLSFPMTANQTIFVFVGAFNVAGQGPFTFTIN